MSSIATNCTRRALLPLLNKKVSMCIPKNTNTNSFTTKAKGKGTANSSATSNKATVPPRKKVSPEERKALRAARKERAAQQAAASSEASTSTHTTSASASASSSTSAPSTAAAAASAAGASTTTKKPMDPRIVFGLGAGLPTLLIGWGIADEDSPPANFARMIGLTNIIEDFADEYARPTSNKLLPDWSQMPQVPPDMDPPPTLILDLENTLVNSTWDRKHGWRHAKRPGVDRFLYEMSQYYEVVIHSSSPLGLAEPVVINLDKSGCAMHHLYREHSYYKDATYMKDLSSMNRNMNKIILLDDDPKAASLNPDNLIKVKPYDDPSDKKDDTLERITPFLIEVAKEGYSDIPRLLSQFRGMDADEIANELDRRADNVRNVQSRQAKRGLGAFSSMGRSHLPQPEMTPVPERQRYKGLPGAGANGNPQAPTAKELVGADPTAGDKSKDVGLSGWFQRRQQDQMEENMRKMEHWNEVMMKKREEKNKAAEGVA